MMSLVILTLAVAALGHFIYEGILAPSARMELRFKVFAERDRIRSIRCHDLPQWDESATAEIERLANSGVRLISAITISGFASAIWKTQWDPEREKQFDYRWALIRSCTSKDAKKSVERVQSAVRWALLVNSPGFVILLCPLLLAYLVLVVTRRASERCAEVVATWIEFARRQMNLFLVIPEVELKYLFPSRFSIR